MELSGLLLIGHLLLVAGAVCARSLSPKSNGTCAIAGHAGYWQCSFILQSQGTCASVKDAVISALRLGVGIFHLLSCP